MPLPDPDPPPKPKPVPVSKLLPVKKSAAPPPGRQAPPPAEDDDAPYGVAAEEPAAPPPPAEEIEEGYGVAAEDEPVPQKRSNKRRPPQDEDDVPANGWGGDPGESDTPRRRKKKKRPRDLLEDLDDRERERAAAEQQNAVLEWGLPLFLCFLGLLLTVAAVVIVANKSSAEGTAVSVGLLLLVTLGFTAVLIPCAVVALMVVGGVLGIEYGTVTHTLRSLAAVTVLVNGIYFFGAAVGFFGAVAAPALACMVSFGLLTALFKLDVFETFVSLVALNFTAFVAKTIFFLIVLAMLSKWAGKPPPGPDAGDGPGFNLPPAGNQFDPAGNGGRNRRPFDPGANE